MYNRRSLGWSGRAANNSPERLITETGGVYVLLLVAFDKGGILATAVETAVDACANVKFAFLTDVLDSMDQQDDSVRLSLLLDQDFLLNKKKEQFVEGRQCSVTYIAHLDPCLVNFWSIFRQEISRHEPSFKKTVARAFHLGSESMKAAHCSLLIKECWLMIGRMEYDEVELEFRKEINYQICALSNEILNGEGIESQSDEFENEETAERNELPTADNEEDTYDVGSPKNLGPFDTIDLAIKEVEDFAKEKHFSVRILSSNYDKKTNEKKNATVLCMHFGKPVLKKYVPKSNQLAHRNTESQRCGCKFEVYFGRAKNGECSINIRSTIHNHSSISEDPLAQTLKKKITPEQIKFVTMLFKAGSTPTSIREALSQKYLQHIFTKRLIYNVITKIKKAELNELTPIQFLINTLSDGGRYTYETVVNGHNGKVECLFLMRKDMFSLSNRFNTALVMDATYKTNRFGLPLVQVCGITNANKTFVLCQAFLRNEREDRYEWLINQMKKHCFSEHTPINISTDRDLALLNALKTELPEVKHLLCRWHISKKVLEHIPKVFNGLEKDPVTAILVNWSRVVFSCTEKDYANNLAALIKALPRQNSLGTVYDLSLFAKYLQSVWLNNHKEKFVSAWTDKFTHLGTTSSSRTEDTVLKQQHTEIVVDSRKQTLKASNQLRIPLFHGLFKVVTTHTLQKAFERHAHARLDILTTAPEEKLKPCTGSFSKTLGIPCSHQIREILLNDDGTMLTKHDFHEQWWIGMPTAETEDKDKDPFSHANLESMKEMYSSLPPFEQAVARRLLECMKTGQFPLSLQDSAVVQSKGTPKGAGNRKQDRAASTTQRNSSAFEYVEMMKMKKTTFKRKQKSQKKMKIEEGEKASTVDDDDLDSDSADDDNKDESGKPIHREADYGQLLPKNFYDISDDIDKAAYDQMINIKGDGFCGFRTLAHQIFDSQDAFMEVKFAMRDRLADVKASYVEHFRNYDISQLERIVTYGIGPEKGDKVITLKKPYHCTIHHWFLAPECAQLAACTFNRPVSVFTSGEANTFLPVFPQEKMKVSVALVLMHFVATRRGSEPNHWVTVKL